MKLDGKSEDVRDSNLVFEKLKIQGFLNFYFAVLGIGSSIVASEINIYHNDGDQNKEWIILLFSICNISTIFLSKLLIVDFLLVVISIIAHYMTFL